MWNGLEKRLSRLEKRLAERTHGPSVCNCRVHTRFHNAECLAAVLKGIPWVCPIHGIRQLGRFTWTPKQYLLSYRNGDDNPYCPCPPHPWRSFVLSNLNKPRKGPPNWEEHDAARKAWDNLPPDPILDCEEGNRRLQEESCRIDALCEEYWAACQEWFEKSGRDLTNQPELAKLIWLRAREHDGQESRPSV